MTQRCGDLGIAEILIFNINYDLIIPIITLKAIFTNILYDNTYD